MPTALSFQHLVLQPPWLFLPGTRELGSGTGLAKTGGRLELSPPLQRLWFAPSCRHPYGHDWSCQLHGQPEFFSSTASLLGGQGLLGKSRSLEQDSFSFCMRATRDPMDLFHLLRSTRSQWAEPPCCGCQAPLIPPRLCPCKLALWCVASDYMVHLSTSRRACWVEQAQMHRAGPARCFSFPGFVSADPLHQLGKPQSDVSCQSL